MTSNEWTGKAKETQRRRSTTSLLLHRQGTNVRRHFTGICDVFIQWNPWPSPGPGLTAYVHSVAWRLFLLHGHEERRFGRSDVPKLDPDWTRNWIDTVSIARLPFSAASPAHGPHFRPFCAILPPGEIWGAPQRNPVAAVPGEAVGFRPFSESWRESVGSQSAEPVAFDGCGGKMDVVISDATELPWLSLGGSQFVHVGTSAG